MSESQNEYDYDGDLRVLTASGADVGQNSGFGQGGSMSGFTFGESGSMPSLNQQGSFASGGAFGQNIGLNFGQEGFSSQFGNLGTIA